jgi:hypothetical protein
MMEGSTNLREERNGPKCLNYNFLLVVIVVDDDDDDDNDDDDVCQ